MRYQCATTRYYASRRWTEKIVALQARHVAHQGHTAPMNAAMSAACRVLAQASEGAEQLARSFAQSPATVLRDYRVHCYRVL